MNLNRTMIHKLPFKCPSKNIYELPTKNKNFTFKVGNN